MLNYSVAELRINKLLMFKIRKNKELIVMYVYKILDDSHISFS